MIKKDLRQSIREQRCRVDPYQQITAADQLAFNLKTSRLLRRFNRIACYLASNCEIDTWPIIEHLWFLKKQVYLPVVSHLPWTPLWFAPFHPDMDLKTNKFGILEPDIHPGKRITARQLDLIFIPLVAFDSCGNRLGMGQGFYDRSLKFKHHRKKWCKPLLSGLAYDFQGVGDIENDSWDIPLNYMVTDSRFIHFAASD